MQATALRSCKHDPVKQPVQRAPDPLVTNAVYIREPCNASASSHNVAASEDAAALQREVRDLQKQVARKEAALRVRNNQLADISKQLQERESLWNVSSASAPPSPSGCLIVLPPRPSASNPLHPECAIPPSSPQCARGLADGGGHRVRNPACMHGRHAHRACMARRHMHDGWAACRASTGRGGGTCAAGSAGSGDGLRQHCHA
jgi:hypothetical protein